MAISMPRSGPHHAMAWQQETLETAMQNLRSMGASCECEGSTLKAKFLDETIVYNLSNYATAEELQKHFELDLVIRTFVKQLPDTVGSANPKLQILIQGNNARAAHIDGASVYDFATHVLDVSALYEKLGIQGPPQAKFLQAPNIPIEPTQDASAHSAIPPGYEKLKKTMQDLSRMHAMHRWAGTLLTIIFQGEQFEYDVSKYKTATELEKHFELDFAIRHLVKQILGASGSVNTKLQILIASSDANLVPVPGEDVYDFTKHDLHVLALYNRLGIQKLPPGERLSIPIVWTELAPGTDDMLPQIPANLPVALPMPTEATLCVDDPLLALPEDLSGVLPMQTESDDMLPPILAAPPGASPLFPIFSKLSKRGYFVTLVEGGNALFLRIDKRNPLSTPKLYRLHEYANIDALLMHIAFDIRMTKGINGKKFSHPISAWDYREATLTTSPAGEPVTIKLDLEQAFPKVPSKAGHDVPQMDYTYINDAIENLAL